jgi:hypothetical protein
MVPTIKNNDIIAVNFFFILKINLELNIFFNQHIIVIFQSQIALVVDKIIGVSGFGIQNIRKKFKIKSFTQ